MRKKYVSFDQFLLMHQIAYFLTPTGLPLTQIFLPLYHIWSMIRVNSE